MAQNDAREQARVMVTVKAYPQLSHRSGEVVCVAGIRLDADRPTWIRLFPVPFRDLPDTARFKKYDIVSLGVRRGKDTRPESYVPSLEGLTVERSVAAGRDGGWTERRERIGPLLAQTTMCRLYRENEGGARKAPSLGLIKPEVLDVTVEPNLGFDADRKRLAELAAEATLFGPAKDELAPAPYTVKYRYRYAEGRLPRTRAVADRLGSRRGRPQVVTPVPGLRDPWTDPRQVPGPALRREPRHALLRRQPAALPAELLGLGSVLAKGRHDRR